MTTTATPARWRYDIQLTSPDVLRRAMKHRGYTVRGLAKEVGCADSVVGHLRTGRRKTCSPEVAREIEEVLDITPRGVLFTGRISGSGAVPPPAVKAMGNRVIPRRARR